MGCLGNFLIWFDNYFFKLVHHFQYVGLVIYSFLGSNDIHSFESFAYFYLMDYLSRS